MVVNGVPELVRRQFVSLVLLPVVVRKLRQALPGGVLRPCPAVLVVESIAERVKMLVPTWRRYVQVLAGLQVHGRIDDVDMNPAIFFQVLDCRHGVAA